MLTKKNKVISMCFLFLIGCSSEEYSDAMHSYQQAKSTSHISSLVASLEVLARLNPEKYFPELTIAKSAQLQLLQAQRYLKQENYYEAYLSSHNSFRQLYTVDSKEILKKSGVVLLPILKAQGVISKSYLNLPLLPEKLLSFSAVPVTEWDLIKVNTLLKKMSENILTLKASLNTLQTVEKNSMGTLSVELLQWEAVIGKQIQSYQQTKNYLINLVLYRSASVLININKKLFNQSLPISTLFSSKNEKKAMTPFFNKAQKEYIAYQQLIENIYFSSSQKTSENHTDWYKKWKKIETSILKPEISLSDYSFKAEERIKNLQPYLNNDNIKQPQLDEYIDNFSIINQQYVNLNILIEKLMKDAKFLY
ncbi:MAG: hypothetical protein ACI9YH_000687 [Colwellia sp.]|jgi:hypothetical protein